MMRQQILGRVLPALARGVVARTFAADAAVPAAAGALAEAYKKVAPNLDPPSTPAAFLGERPATPAALPEKITLNFVLPHQSPFWEKQVDSVIIPATTGQMGVLPGHVPSIAELKPGVLSVVDGSSESKYFVSSGFAIVNPNSVVDVCAVEAVPLDQLDPEEVKKGLATYSAKLASGTGTELEKAEAQIGVDVHSAMSAALGI